MQRNTSIFPNKKKLQLLSNMQRELTRLEASMTASMSASNGDTKNHLDTVRYNTLDGIKGWLAAHPLIKDGTLSKEVVTAARNRHPSLVHYLAVRLLRERTEAGFTDALNWAAKWDLREAVHQAHNFDMLTPENVASALKKAVAYNSQLTVNFLLSLKISKPGNFSLSSPMNAAKEIHEQDTFSIKHKLSKKLWLSILDLLGPKDLLISVAQLSKKLYKLVHNERLGKKLLESKLTYLAAHPENPDNPQILQSYRLMQSLFADASLDTKLDWRYFKVHKNEGATRRTHPNGTQFSLPCQLPGTFHPVEMSFRVDGIRESDQVAYTGVRLATNLQNLHTDRYKYKECLGGNHGAGVYLTPSFVIDNYYYATTIEFEESLFRIVTKCRIRDFKVCWSTWGCASDDGTWQDISRPNLHRLDGFYDKAPPEFLAKSENVQAYALIITKLSNANLFYPPSYKDSQTTPRWPTDPLHQPFRLNPGL
jgi:hypothetical protein